MQNSIQPKTNDFGKQRGVWAVLYENSYVDV